MRVAQLAILCGLMLLLSAFGCGSGGAKDSSAPPDDKVPDFQDARAFADLQAQCDLGPREPGSAGHTACRTWIAAQLEAAGATVTQQPFDFNAATGDTFRGTNIIGAFAGTGRQSGLLLLGAHWDTRPVADEDDDPANRDEPILGANDGASGVAVLTEMARLFAATPPPRPVVLVFFDLEDLGNTDYTDGEPLAGFSLGSRYFASHMGQFQPNQAIVVDMVGDANLQLYQESYSLASAQSMVLEVWSRGRALGFGQFVDGQIGQIIDDHLPLIQADVPAMDIIDFDFPGPGSNRFWHTLDDTVANCSADSLEAVGQTLTDWLYRASSSRTTSATERQVAAVRRALLGGAHHHHG